MSTRHVKPPPPLFLLFFLTSPLSLVRPRRSLSLAPTAGCCRRRAQGVSRLAAFQRPPSGSAFTRPSTMAVLMGRVDYTPVCYLSIFVSARVIPITDVSFSRSCYEVHGACDNRINLYPAAPIRLAKVLLAWTIAQEGMGLIFGTADRQVPICDAVLQPHIRPARHTRDWGVGTQYTVDAIV
jgi:hypothetical protein